jgi:hypothetical protein
MGLEIQPALGVGAEEAGQTQGCFGCNSPFAGADLINAALRNADGLGQPVTSYIERLQKVLQQDFTGMYRRKVTWFHGLISVNDLIRKR